MKLKKAFAFALLLLLFLSIQSRAQDRFSVVNDAYILKHLHTQIYPLDSEAKAVVLYEKMSIAVDIFSSYYREVKTMHRIVKILDEDALDEANVDDYYYTKGTIGSGTGKIFGTTYTLGDNGIVIKTPLDKSAIFITKYNDEVNIMKFTMPAVKVGSVIDYTYEIISPLTQKLPKWFFQDKYPALQTEYEINLPGSLGFVYITQGKTTFKQYDSWGHAEEDSSEAYYVLKKDHTSSENYGIWCRKNVTPLKFEPFSGNIYNYAERLEIQIQDPQHSYGTLDSQSIKKAWKDFTDVAWDHKMFGRQVAGENSYLKKIVDSLTAGNNNDRDKAWSIFNYVRNNIYCNDTIALFAEKDIKKTFLGHEGNVAEINLLLVAMLQKAGLNASPLILNTMGQLVSDDNYPVIDRYNNTVAIIRQPQGDPVLLDASCKYNAFGKLPFYCFNSSARVIDGKGGAQINLDPHQNRERTVNVVKVVTFNDTALVANLMETMGANASRIFREKFAADSGKILSYLYSSLSERVRDGGVVSGLVCENLQNPDTEVIVHYTLSKKISKGTLYFATDILKLFNENPYKPMKRTMPVELPWQTEYIYSLTAALPQNVKPEDVYKPALLSYDDGRIRFKHFLNYDPDMHFFSVTTQYKSVETFFPSTEYEVFRAFHNNVLDEINKIVVFKIE